MKMIVLIFPFLFLIHNVSSEPKCEGVIKWGENPDSCAVMNLTKVPQEITVSKCKAGTICPIGEEDAKCKDYFESKGYDGE